MSETTAADTTGPQRYRGEIELGFLTVPFANHTKFPDIAKWAGEAGYKCLSIAAWPTPEAGGSERAGHDAFVAAHCGDLASFDESRASEMRGAMEAAGVKANDMGYFENMSTANAPYRAALHTNFRHICRIGKMLGATHVGTFPGRNENMTVKESLADFLRTTGPELQRVASGEGVRVYFENCPMEGLVPDKAIGNVAYCPENWRSMFQVLDWDMMLDPSHMVWQGIDPARAIKEFHPKIMGIHAKDGKIIVPRFRPVETQGMAPLPYNDGNYERGIVHDDHPVKKWGAGLYVHAVPGLGDVEWGKSVAEPVREVGLKVPWIVELEDEAFNPREADGARNYCRAGFSAAIRTLKPYCAAEPV